MSKIKNILSGLAGKTGAGILQLALGAALSKYDVSGADIVAAIGAVEVVIGILHKIVKNWKK